jgi:adenosine deaminase
MPLAFITYRRADSAGVAGRLYDRLVLEFGKACVFMDVAGGIPKGADFPTEIERKLLAANVMVVVIGPQWLTCTDSKGNPRIHNSDDWVANEIASALERNIFILPVRIDDTPMPAAADLPKRIAALHRIEAGELRTSSWDYDLGRVLSILAPKLRPYAGRRKVAIGLATAVAMVVAGLFIARAARHTALPQSSSAVPVATELSVSQPAVPSAQPELTPEQQTARYFDSIRDKGPQRIAFLTAMPKGGDLHSHLSGAVYAEDYLSWAVNDNLCINLAAMSIMSGPCDANAGRPPVRAIVQDAPLYSQAIDAMSMRNWNRALNGHDHFFQAFAKFGPASDKIGDMISEVSTRAAAEQVSYVELLLTPDGGLSTRMARETEWDSDLTRLRAKLLAMNFYDVIMAAKRRLDQAEARKRDLLHCGTPQAQAGCRVTLRYIAQAARASPAEIVFAQMLAGFEIASNDARVVAVDLVQPEDSLVALQDFSLHMKMLEFLHGHYPRVPITLQAGELVDGLVPNEALRFHIRESVRIGRASRIGLGTDIMSEDEAAALLNEMASRHVPVEIALSSNDWVLGVRGTSHPLRTYLQYGVPVVLVTDDAGVTRSTLTLEFAKAADEHGIDYVTLKRMAHNSIEFSFADSATKARLRKDLDAAYTTFEKATRSEQMGARPRTTGPDRN